MKKTKKLPPLKYLNECFVLAYDGKLFWRARPRSHFATTRAWNTINKRQAGKEAGTLSRDDGYRQVGIVYKGKTTSYLAHRVVFLLAHGWMPNEIDHADGNRINNDPANLRQATRAENLRNARLSKANTSGFKGVCFNKERGLWQANIIVKGIRKTIGRFDTPEAAHTAYCDAAKIHFGEFARTH